MKWINVKNKLPQHGKGSFLACWQTQGNIMFVCFVDIHSNYIQAGSSGDICGHGDRPKFSHWMPLPNPPPNQAMHSDGESLGVCPNCKSALSAGCKICGKFF